jgi:hypothetical protein
MWCSPLIADVLQGLPALSEHAQQAGADATYDKPVNWWLAWVAIGLAAFAAGVVAWLFWLIINQDKKLDNARDSEVKFLRETIVAKLDTLAKDITGLRELVLGRRGPRQGG